MLQITVSVVLWLCIANTASSFDPTKFDYCSKKCTVSGAEHSACKCDKLDGKRKVLYDDVEHFRTSMVDMHNFYRNGLANGVEEKTYGFPPAANMHVLNYDLELEYIANCWAKSIWDGHDKCRMKHDFNNNAGQNIYGANLERTKKDYAEHFNRSFQSWYKEIVNITDVSIVDRFRNNNQVKKTPESKIGHFTQLAWASIRLIGCAKVFIEKNPKRIHWRSIVLCNYQGRPNEGGSGNMRNGTIYKRGKACSQCPAGEKCNNEYGGKWDGLCGKTEPIPKEKPFIKDNDKASQGNQLFATGIVMAVLIVNFFV